MPDNNPQQHIAASAASTATDAESLLIRRVDLPGSAEAHRFIGSEHGGVPISLFLVDNRPGEGPLLHRHPYPELFIVHAGEADFEIDGTRLIATAGDILVAPAETAHRFTNTGDEELSLTAIHTAPNMETEWLEASSAHRSPSARRGPRPTQQPRAELPTCAPGRTGATPC